MGIVTTSMFNYLNVSKTISLIKNENMSFIYTKPVFTTSVSWTHGI